MPIEIRRQTKQTALFRAIIINNISTGNCPPEENECDAHQTTNGKCDRWDMERPYSKPVWKDDGTDIRTRQVLMGNHRNIGNTLKKIAARQSQKDMGSGSAATTEDNNMEWASTRTRRELNRSSAAHQFPAELSQSASLRSRTT